MAVCPQAQEHKVTPRDVVLRLQRIEAVETAAFISPYLLPHHHQILEVRKPKQQSHDNNIDCCRSVAEAVPLRVCCALHVNLQSTWLLTPHWKQFSKPSCYYHTAAVVTTVKLLPLPLNFCTKTLCDTVPPRVPLHSTSSYSLGRCTTSIPLRRLFRLLLTHKSSAGSS